MQLGVGSILEVRFGAKALPEKWTRVLNDQLISAVRGENTNSYPIPAKRHWPSRRQSKAPTERTATTLSGDAAGIWELETGWVRIYSISAREPFIC